MPSKASKHTLVDASVEKRGARREMLQRILVEFQALVLVVWFRLQREQVMSTRRHKKRVVCTSRMRPPGVEGGTHTRLAPPWMLDRSRGSESCTPVTTRSGNPLSLRGWQHTVKYRVITFLRKEQEQNEWVVFCPKNSHYPAGIPNIIHQDAKNAAAPRPVYKKKKKENNTKECMGNKKKNKRTKQTGY
ncbi:hypothetical protein IF1G_01923 [Cordyceps javanica]|uniref:Uncharacterized protein n=1 Tax=Cordyceps javanica TaxID=43265 RepID=A0A545VDA4_9HYPO|nr:hypothetical protein IF1G_01923 [Cordyceps javanica]